MTNFDYKKIEEERIAINMKLAANGVQFIDIKQAYIDEGVKVGSGTVIHPCVTLEGNVEIGCDCVIGQNTRIVNSKIGDDTEILSSVIKDSSVGDETSIGPFAYLRPGSNVGSRCKIGDFVEVKNSSFGDGSKAGHLAYIGDADVGEEVNIGCGVIFVNYDGKNKYRSTVKNGAFIGCNANLISPVKIGEKAYIGAGSTVTEDVEAGNLFVERAKGRALQGWSKQSGLLDE